MRTIRILLQKEFRQIFRNTAILRMIFIMPVIQLIVLPLVANYEVKNISIAVVDHDHSPYSQKLISKITASGYFKLTGYDASFNEAFRKIESEKADLVLEIPAGFERGLVKENAQKLFIAINAINGVKAGLGGSYLANIIGSYNSEIRLQWMQPGRFNTTPAIQPTSSNWFNPLMNYSFYMVPGILVTLVTMIASMQTSLNIVKEKEIGTIEQINVTPIRKYQFLLGKLIPFWVIGIVVFTLGLLVGRIVYGIVPVGNIGLLYLFLAVYLIAMLGFGLLVSTFSDTQQQAMSISFFFTMIFNLMGGLFTPVDSMPPWAQAISHSLPISHFIDSMRMIMLKGSGLLDVSVHLLIVLGIGIGLNIWAVINYKKTT